MNKIKRKERIYTLFSKLPIQFSIQLQKNIFVIQLSKVNIFFRTSRKRWKTLSSIFNKSIHHNYFVDKIK